MSSQSIYSDLPSTDLFIFRRPIKNFQARIYELQFRPLHKFDQLCIIENVKTIAYLRVSSQAQIKDGESIERQRELISNYAKINEISDIEFISDEGISGFNDKREGFQKLIALIKEKKVNSIIVYDLSRLSRKTSTVLNFFDEYVIKRQLEFHSIKEKVDTQTATGKAFIGFSAVFNQFYRDEISQKCKAAKQFKKEKGQYLGGHLPFGFDLNGNLITKNEREIEIIQLIESMRIINKYSLPHICSILNRNNLKTKNGNKWYPESIRRILISNAGLV